MNVRTSDKMRRPCEITELTFTMTIFHAERDCHSYEAMDFHAQSFTARKKMKKALEEGMTCIDCHKGIAHKLPQGYEEDSKIYEEDFET